MPTFLKTFPSSNFWGVTKGPCKKFHVFGENWQRNYFPKLTPFTPMLQLSHSALFYKVLGRVHRTNRLSGLLSRFEDWKNKPRKRPILHPNCRSVHKGGSQRPGGGDVEAPGGGAPGLQAGHPPSTDQTGR